MRVPRASAAVEAARARRAGTAEARTVRIQWFVDEVVRTVAMSLKQRVLLATDLVKNKVVLNVGKPVTKATGPRGGRVVLDRSKPGEFPRADTTMLMKTIFSSVEEKAPNVIEGYVGTPLDYGLILETKMNRSFLVRTMNEERSKVTSILSGPIK